MSKIDWYKYKISFTIAAEQPRELIRAPKGEKPTEDSPRVVSTQGGIHKLERDRYFSAYVNGSVVDDRQFESMWDFYRVPFEWRD